jgi:hypothetical protein
MEAARISPGVVGEECGFKEEGAGFMTRKKQLWDQFGQARQMLNGRHGD